MFHGLSHPSIRTTKKILAEKFVWHGIRKDVTEWAKNCISCQQSKIHRHIKAPLVHENIPERRFDHIHIDQIGPLPPSSGCDDLVFQSNRISLLCSFKVTHETLLKCMQVDCCAMFIFHSMPFFLFFFFTCYQLGTV